MKFRQCLGKYIIVSAEIAQPKSTGKIHTIDDSVFAKGRVMAKSAECCFDVDDEVLFIRKAGMPLGYEFPPNVMVVNIEDTIVVLETEE